MILICPVCQLSLNAHEKFFSCLNNHSFDIAKQKYINLLLSNEKSSLSPGDNKEMVLSRSHFLNHGYYHPISQALVNVVYPRLTSSTFSSNPTHIADIGCGVGYYLGEMQKNLAEKIANTHYWGIDISKEAIIHASRTYPDITWIVGSAIKIPFASQSVSFLFSIFSPLYVEQMHRILTRDGIVIIITPNQQHLFELREFLFDEVKTIDNDKILIKTQAHFELLEEKVICYSVAIKSKEDILHLLKMTPFYWRSSIEKKAKLAELEALNVTVDVTLRIFKSKN